MYLNVVINRQLKSRGSGRGHSFSYYIIWLPSSVSIVLASSPFNNYNYYALSYILLFVYRFCSEHICCVVTKECFPKWLDRSTIV
jgi:hypothetical protein